MPTTTTKDGAAIFYKDRADLLQASGAKIDPQNAAVEQHGSAGLIRSGKNYGSGFRHRPIAMCFSWRACAPRRAGNQQPS